MLSGPSWNRGPLRPALTVGFGDAVRRAPLVVILWQVNLLFGVILAGLAATALAVTLEGSWYTRSLLHDLDPTAFFALFTYHTPTFKLLGATAATLVVLYLAGWILLHGAVVAAVCGDEDLGMRDTLRAGAGVLPVFLRLAALAAAVFLVLVGGVGVATVGAARLARASAAPFAWEMCLVAGAAAGVSAWIFCSAVHDHARIRCYATGHGAARGYAWAVRFVLHGGKRAFGLALALFLASAALAAFYQSVASRIDADWMTGVVLSILWGQAMLLTRSLFRVWAFASEARLQGEAGGQR
jgi:hypothetical protein